uniref:Uncharacterized protein n=1 Tax=Arundo donax TaxID=35708 RepID=A0A0A8Y1R5_ARUDO
MGHNGAYLVWIPARNLCGWVIGPCASLHMSVGVYK